MKHITHAIPTILIGIALIITLLHVNTLGNKVQESYVTKTELREALKEVNANNNPVLLQKMDSIYKTQ